MRIKQGFELRDVCGEKVIVAEGIHSGQQTTQIRIGNVLSLHVIL